MRVPSIGKIIEKYLTMNPGGYLSPQDEAAANATQSRLTGQAEATAKGRRIRLNRSLVSRGIGGAAALAGNQGVEEDLAAGRESAAQTAGAQRYQAYANNRNYMQDLVGKSFGVEIDAARADRARADARQSTLWNSILGTAPYLVSAFTGLASAAPVAARPAGAGTGAVSSYGLDPSIGSGRRQVNVGPAYN